MSAIDTLIRAHEAKLTMDNMVDEYTRIRKRIEELRPQIKAVRSEYDELVNQAFREWEQEYDTGTN